MCDRPIWGDAAPGALICVNTDELPHGHKYVSTGAGADADPDTIGDEQ